MHTSCLRSHTASQTTLRRLSSQPLACRACSNSPGKPRSAFNGIHFSTKSTLATPVARPYLQRYRCQKEITTEVQIGARSQQLSSSSSKSELLRSRLKDADWKTARAAVLERKIGKNLGNREKS